MRRIAFPGYPKYLELAAEELGFTEVVTRGSPPAQLAALANLCAQASTAEPEHATAILAEARLLRDRLVVAVRAADLIIADVSPLEPRSEVPDRQRPTRPANRPSPSRP